MTAIPGGAGHVHQMQLLGTQPLTQTTTGAVTTPGVGSVSYPTYPNIGGATYAPMPGNAWWNVVPNAVPAFTCICGQKAERKQVVEVNRDVLKHDDKPFVLLGDPRGAVICEDCGIIAFVE